MHPKPPRLASLWRSSGLESPPSGLQRNTTEVMEGAKGCKVGGSECRSRGLEFRIRGSGFQFRDYGPHLEPCLVAGIDLLARVPKHRDFATGRGLGKA